jgi:hypothetical protein
MHRFVFVDPYVDEAAACAVTASRCRVLDLLGDER